MRKLIIGFMWFVSSVCHAQSETITQQALTVNQMSTDAYTIVDVRSPEEFAAGHIKGAINIPFNEIETHQQELAKLTDTTLVVYCRSGRRADIFIEALVPKGYTLKHLEGDMNKWLAESLPVVKK
ncbi:rhodanese-like domain-containing protein [Pseudoalteromonas sp. HM-SA03]|uniref:rhodanese-like domain-containing protein n=1 Tax=Pseudoalteromonas sp. HM-SA03 TaxID=2029678 RepID=UPI000BAE1749|nr:rhodanese-like domain-containing protein [Pseudoalteromonas sp. HM-SA03]PAY01589.1 rhodanese-like domain-containing protein [Pseudoalteromonas sp. HM-SA03]